MDSRPRVRVLGRVTIDRAGSEVMVDRRQAREVLALLVAHRNTSLGTSDICDALWDSPAPTSAPTIVHGHIRRLRDALGEDSVIHDGDGYRLVLPADAVDLWELDDAVGAGDLDRARALWDEPIFGRFAQRPWARDALSRLGHLGGPSAESLPGRVIPAALPTAHLVGRHQELGAVTTALTRSRLVSIVGLAGVGKTRLALEVVAATPEAVHVDLGAAVGPVAARIAGGLGLNATGEVAWDRRMVTSTLARRQVLVVLDGCQGDLADVAAEVAEILAGCRGVRILATSRVALGVAGEMVVPLLPFENPQDPKGDSVALLTARMATLGIEVRGGDRPRLAAVCAGAAGVPLAIELAATDAIFDQARAAGARSDEAAPDAALSPGAAVDGAVGQAIDALTPATKRTLVRLGHLCHGFTPAMLAAVTDSDVSAPGVLHELHASGLLAHRRTAPAIRLGLAEPVRQRITSTPDLEALSDAATALETFTDAVRPLPAGPVDAEALADAVDELVNVDGVLDELECLGELPRALTLAASAAETWGESGNWTRGGARLAGLLASVRPDGVDVSELDADRTGSVVVPALTWADAVRAHVTAGATYAVMHADRDRLACAARIAAECDDGPLEAHLVFRIAVAAGYRGDLDGTAAAVERLRVIAQGLDNDYARALADQIEALARLASGAHVEAADRLIDVARHLITLDAPADAARSLRFAGLAYANAGSLQAALAQLLEADGLARASGARGTLATIRSEIVEIRHRAGALNRAEIIDARDTVIAVGNLRAGGLLARRLGLIERDPAALAEATLDLLEADRVWAALTLTELVDLLPARHALRRRAPIWVAALRTQWGGPLGAAESGQVERLVGSQPAGRVDWSDQDESELREMLRRISR